MSKAPRDVTRVRTVNDVMVVPPSTMRVAEVDAAGGVVGTVGAAVVGAVVGVGAAVVGQGEKNVDTGDATNAGLEDRDVTLAVVVLRGHHASAAALMRRGRAKNNEWDEAETHSVAPVRISRRVTVCAPTVATSVDV